MITGFNTDIDFDGTIFHVQTEDRGLGNPIVETLIYTGGEILTSRKSSYAELVGTDAYSEAEIQNRIETQHRELIRQIHTGRFSPGALKPFGHGIVTNQSFDEVVLTFLAEHAVAEAVADEVG